MKRTLAPLCLLSLLLGCNRTTVDDGRGSAGEAASADAAVAPAPPAAITRFGITFRLVTVEPRPDDAPAVGKFGVAFPQESYYLGQSVVTWKQCDALRQTAAELERDKPAEQRKRFDYPSEWKNAYNFGIELSALDPDYEYSLPTREQWVFACMNGFDQDCPGTLVDGNVPPSKRPNKYGIEGFMNYDIECGNLPGLHFGLARLTTKALPPECCCADYAYGNPEGDDGLNDIIEARYVLKPQAKR